MTSSAAKDNSSLWLKLLVGLCVLYLVSLIVDSFNRYTAEDEYSFLINVLNFYVYRTIIPAYANYPTFYSYLIFLPIFIVYLLFYFINGYPAEGLSDPYFFAFLFQAEIMNWIWVGRAVSIAAAVLILFLGGRYVFKKFVWPAALFASGVLIVDPLGVYFRNASYAIPDIIVALLATVILLSCFRAVEADDNSSLFRILALAGIVSCAKANGVLTLPPVIVTFFLVKRPEKPLLTVIKGIAYFLGGIFVASPVLLAKPQAYAAAFLAETAILYNPNNAGHFLGDWLWLFRAVFAKGWTIPGLLIASIVYSVFKGNKTDKIYHAFLFPSLIVLTGLSKHTLLYFIFLYPVSMIFVARFINDIYVNLGRSHWKRVLSGVLAVILILAGSSFTTRLARHVRPDNRALAREWVVGNVKGAHIFLYDSAYVPQLGAVTSLNVLHQDYRKDIPYQNVLDEYQKKYPAYTPVSLGQIQYNLDVITAQGPIYLITSDYCYRRYIKTDGPEGFVTYDTNFENVKKRFYKMKRFYTDLLSGKSGFLPLKTFSQGSGPVVQIFIKE